MSLKICACDGMKAAVVLGEIGNAASNANRIRFIKGDFMAGGVLRQIPLNMNYYPQNSFKSNQCSSGATVSLKP
jgi:hypothetical protein